MSQNFIQAPPKPLNSVLDLIGNTPVVEVKNIDTGKCRLFLKMETQNPMGSIKDRIGLSMISKAETDGKISSGYTLVEATAGNTGLALAQAASSKGYKLILIIPDKMSDEKIINLRALGADVIITKTSAGKGDPENFQTMAERIASEIPKGFYVNQFNNPANPLIHEKTTAPEIWEQMDHALDAIVLGVGTGGTVTGLSRYFSKVAPALELILADPEGSVLAGFVNTGRPGVPGSYFVEGIGGNTVPALADLSRIKKGYSISDKESFDTATNLMKKEGIFCGSSSGTLVASALRYCREQETSKRVLTFICDGGVRYLSKMYNPEWLKEKNLS
ncbi:MAG: cysteine synthase family protein [Leptospira sp.]|nr:cysteine synthase family protein [Leptospira sp.]